MEKRLYRNKDERMIWGVCGGLARYFNIDPTIVRVIAVVLALANGVGIIAYVILAIVVPLESSKTGDSKEVIKENIEEIKQTASDLGNEIGTTFSEEKDTSKIQRNYRSIIGIILVIAGGLFLLANFNLFWWLRWDNLWPLILIAIGVVIIFGARGR